MRLYLDLCCLNRPFDDQTQDRIRLESEAVILILGHITAGEWELVGSEVLQFEIEQTPDSARGERVRELTLTARYFVRVGASEIARAEELEAMGFRAYDALHLACAEAGGAEAFLSTDDQMLRVASRGSKRLRLRVANPEVWIREMTER